MAEAAGDGDWAAWTRVLAGLDEDTRADVVRQSSLVIAMLCDREAERRGWLKPEFRCVVPASSFCEYDERHPKRPTWFVLGEDRPL